MEAAALAREQRVPELQQGQECHPLALAVAHDSRPDSNPPTRELAQEEQRPQAPSSRV